MSIRTLLVFLFTVAAVSLLAGCYGHRSHHATRDDTHLMKHLVGELNLTPAQQVRIESILGEVTALKLRGQALRRQWVSYSIEQLENPEVDLAAGEQFRREQIAQFEALVNGYSANLTTLRRTLNTEQRARLAELIEKHGGRHERF